MKIAFPRWFRTLHTHLDLWLTLLLGGGAFFIYLKTLAPTVVSAFDDSLEFVLVAFRLAIAHPTGYPLYTLLAKLFTFLPVGDVAFRVNLLSAVAAALAVAGLYHAGRRLGQGAGAAFTGAATFMASPVFWSQATVAEVYALNTLFVVLLLGLALSLIPPEHAEPEETTLLLLAALTGLSLTHHRTSILLAPALALAVVWGYGRLRPELSRGRVGSWRLLARCLVAFLLPLSLYLYLPLRGHVGSLDGTYVNTLAGAFAWISGSAYNVFLTENPLQQAARTPAFVLNLLVQQFSTIGLILAGLGLIGLFRRHRRGAVILVLSALTEGGFAFFYRVSDAPVFFIPVFLIVALWIGEGITLLWAGREWLLHRPGLIRSTAGLIGAGTAALVIGLPGWGLTSHFGPADRSYVWTVHDYGQTVLRQPVEEGATIIGILGETTLLRYFQETQGLRRDLVLVAADRDDDRRRAVAEAIAAGRPVYLTRPLPGLEQRYSLTALGPLIAVDPAPMRDKPPLQVERPVNFGNKLHLLGYDLGQPLGRRRGSAGIGSGVPAGESLAITFYWQTPAALDTDYQVSVRLVNTAGVLVARHDGTPVHGAYPTHAWRPGEVIADTHYLPVLIGTPPGTYRVQMVVYPLTTLQGLTPVGLPVNDGVFELTTVEVILPAVMPSLPSLPVHYTTEGSNLPDQESVRLHGWEEVRSLEALGAPRRVLVNFDNQIELYSFGVSHDPLPPGQTIAITLLWRAMRRMTDDHQVFLQLVDREGQLWASVTEPPVNGLRPTSRWQIDEVVRDVHWLALPADLPDGEYRLIAGLMRTVRRTGWNGQPQPEATTEAVTVLRWTRRSSDQADLGPVTVKGRTHAFVAPPIAHTQEAAFGKTIRLLGYRLDGERDGRLIVRPGDTLTLTLYWQATARPERSYTVFTHLLDAGGQIRGQQDNIPGAGTLPTRSWLPGEVLTDTYTLPVALDAPAGEHHIEVGFYEADGGARLPVFDAAGQPAGDRVILDQTITVRVDKP